MTWLPTSVRSYGFWSLVLIVGILILLGFLLLFNAGQFFASDTYVNELRFIERDGSINVDHASGGTASFREEDGLQYDDGRVKTVFSHYAYYEGQAFSGRYVREGRTIMRYGPDMVPGDGVIDIFIVEKIVSGIPVVHVFLDGDWRREVGSTNIYYGPRFEHQLTFDYTTQASGIYVMTFEDDPERFSQDYRLHEGGIIVGDMTEDTYLTATAVKFI